MLNILIKKIFYKNKLECLHRKNDLYSQLLGEDEIYHYQLEKFNLIWKNAYTNSPFYQMWMRKHDLPPKIGSLEELEQFPILTKQDIQDNKYLIFKNLKDYSVISTGGSTGEPTVFATDVQESNFLYSNVYYGRSWWGISPLDEILLFWGHSHIFGGGFKGQLYQYKRMIADWLINTNRLNAYDMSLKTLEKYSHSVQKSNPNVIIGYTSILFKLAKYFKENNLEIGDKSNLRCIIVTSETVSDNDILLIEDVFKVPCVIEYGMAETGVIAYSKNEAKNMHIFWDAFIARAATDNTLLVTTIYDKLFPLINYRTDDIVGVQKEYKSSILELNNILGRKKDILCVKSIDGSTLELSGILMVHLLKNYPNIYEIVFQQLENDCIKIKYTSNVDLETSKIADYFFQNIKKDHPDIKETSVVFEKVDKIEKTIAGKEKWIENDKA